MATSVRDSGSLGDYYAEIICARAGVADPRIKAAFAAVPRELFLGDGPWPIAVEGDGYVRTPSADPAFVYADVLVGLVPERSLNNGEPSSHARWLGAAAITAGETVAHVGAGSGYYSAIIAELVGREGRLEAFEIDEALAAAAARNLSPWTHASVQSRSGLETPFPVADVIYVNAGVSRLAEAWLDAIRPGGRIVVPLTVRGWGAMMMFTARNNQVFDARVISPVAIFPCVGGQDEVMTKRLAEAYGFPPDDAGPPTATPLSPAVQSLRRGTAPDNSCWLAGDGWWLSTRPAG